MSRRQKIWAARARGELIRLFGARCRICGARDFLEFDCIRPTGDRHHRMDTSARVSFYRRQAALGNLQVLCQRCNAIKSDDDMDRVFGALFVGMLQPLPTVEIQPF